MSCEWLFRERASPNGPLERAGMSPWTAKRRRVCRPLNGFALGVINMLRLADWVSVLHCFDFEPSSGSYTRQHLPEPRRSLHGFVGFAQELRLGRGKKALIAVYRDGAHIYVSVGQALWPLHSRDVTIEHNSRLFTSELIVRAGAGGCPR